MTDGPPITRFLAPARLAYTVHAGEPTATFLRGILQRRILGLRCPESGAVYVPPRAISPTCGRPCTEWVELGEVGTITTFSVVRIPFQGQVLEPPYACAHILLDGAGVPLLHIVGDCDVDEIRIGMRVSAVWAEELAPTFASVRYFRPTAEPDVPLDELREYL